MPAYKLAMALGIGGAAWWWWSQTKDVAEKQGGPGPWAASVAVLVRTRKSMAAQGRMLCVECSQLSPRWGPTS